MLRNISRKVCLVQQKFNAEGNGKEQKKKIGSPPAKLEVIFCQKKIREFSECLWCRNHFSRQENTKAKGDEKARKIVEIASHPLVTMRHPLPPLYTELNFTCGWILPLSDVPRDFHYLSWWRIFNCNNLIKFFLECGV